VVAQLLQTFEAQLTHTLDIGIGQVRCADHFGEECDRGLHKPRDRGERQDRRIGTDVDIEIGSESRNRVRDFQRRSPGAAFIEKVRRERG
jgi:hypothetical protein